MVLDQNAAGIGRYIRELMSAFVDLYQVPDQIHGFFQSGIVIEGISPHYPNRPIKGSIGRLWYEQMVIPRKMRKVAYDVIHFSDYQVPVFQPLARTVATVHDLVAFKYPHLFERQRGELKRFLMMRSVRVARHLIVPSIATQNDLREILGVPAHRITVIPHGVNRRGTPDPTSKWPHPYFLAVGTVEPRKNFSRLIQAYQHLFQEHRDIPDLIIAGRWGWMYEETVALPEKLGVAERVKFLQYVSEDTLATLYQHATAMVYPSLYEGFGLPVIEAMSYGIPVVASGAGALSEIGNGAVIRVSPTDTDSIAQGLLTAMKGKAVLQDAVTLGINESLTFTWHETARRTRMVYQQVAQGG